MAGKSKTWQVPDGIQILDPNNPFSVWVSEMVGQKYSEAPPVQQEIVVLLGAWIAMSITNPPGQFDTHRKIFDECMMHFFCRAAQNAQVLREIYLGYQAANDDVDERENGDMGLDYAAKITN